MDEQQQLATWLERIAQADQDQRLQLNQQLQSLGGAEITALGKELGLRPLGTAVQQTQAALVQLTQQIDRLDPAYRGPLHGSRRLFGLFPLGSRLQDYFQDYVRQQVSLRQSMDRLRDARDALMREDIDNQTQRLRLSKQLAQLRRLAQLAKALGDRLPELKSDDSAQQRWIAEELSYLLQQRHADLLSQILVAQQGLEVLALTQQLNRDLLSGLEHALNTTVAALNLAVRAAAQLTQQELALHQLHELQQTSQDHLGQLSGSLKPPVGENPIGLEHLGQAFAELRQTLSALGERTQQPQNPPLPTSAANPNTQPPEFPWPD
ncbi:MAG: toxic anion resistance protein [Gammaproteobacteria bacterium]|nr:toxic anion resistance protein [Gammaproteobacteria bacterium]